MSVQAEVLISILPIVTVVLASVLFFFYLLWDYKKTHLIIEQGGTPPESKFNEKLLLIGIVSLFVGIGLLIFFILSGGISDSLLGGIIPTAVGIGIIVFFLIQERRSGRDSGSKG